MDTEVDAKRNKWTFLREGIRFNDDETAGFVFRFVDISEVFHFTWDITMTAYLPYMQWMKMPDGAEIIRIHSSNQTENWCWGKRGRLLMYKAWREGAADRYHCYVYIYNLEDATVHRYMMPQNVYGWEWKEELDAFVVITGNLRYSTREIENQKHYIIPAPTVDKQRIAHLDIWVELVDEPTPHTYPTTPSRLKYPLIPENNNPTSKEANPLPVDNDTTRPPMNEAIRKETPRDGYAPAEHQSVSEHPNTNVVSNPKTRQKTNRITIFDRIGLNRIESRSPLVRKNNMRIQLACVLIGSAILLAILIYKITRGFL